MRCSIILLNMSANWNKLSRAWVRDFLPSSSPSGATSSDDIVITTVQSAIQRTLPFLSDDPTSVPFLCRYRSDVIDPLTTKQVHQLSECVQKFGSLSGLRNKVINQLKENGCDSLTQTRAETTISKIELEDMYVKPPSKGSLEDRIQKEHPELIGVIDELWTHRMSDAGLDRDLVRRAKPMDKAVILLANRIASDVNVLDALVDYGKRKCGVTVKKSSSSSKTNKNMGRKTSPSSSSFETYYDYKNRLSNLRDHQVLAIRRGVHQKALKLGFDIDDELACRIIQQTAFTRKHNHQLYKDAQKDAWNRLLRRRCTSRLWKDASKRAEERSIQVFCDNLSTALLAPPADMNGRNALLALDPGFQAGIKCAVLTGAGAVVSLDTIKFLGTAKDEGKKTLISLLKMVKDMSNECDSVLVVLGNGHGTREAKFLLQEASADANIEIYIQLVTEAGASVWSVTESAQEEFPNEAPSAIACASIGRRYLNPLHELVKIPPKSLGLGMYQHDLTEAVLDGKLNLTSIDAVGEVGVDVNTASQAILQKVPSLTPKLVSKIMQARPIRARQDLLKVSGLGEKTFIHCAGFVRVCGGDEPLDNTMVHPESYGLARWVLKELKWSLSKEVKPQNEHWLSIAKKASAKFDVPEERAHTVINHLYTSITSPDPRLRSIKDARHTTSTAGSSCGCSSLPSSVSTLDALKESTFPLRKICATIRNIVDFGAFLDIGLENDALLHKSKMGDVTLDSLFVGQDIGVDILGVSESDRISVALAGLELAADTRQPKRKMDNHARKRPAKKYCAVK